MISLDFWELHLNLNLAVAIVLVRLLCRPQSLGPIIHLFEIFVVRFLSLSRCPLRWWPSLILGVDATALQCPA